MHCVGLNIAQNACAKSVSHGLSLYRTMHESMYEYIETKHRRGQYEAMSYYSVIS